MASDGTVRAWNREAERTFGYTRQEAVGRDMAQLILPERDREEHRRRLAQAAKTGGGWLVGQRVELEALHRDGREFPVELAVSPMRVDGELIFNTFLHDISARRRTKLELRRLAAVVDSSNDAIVSSTPDGTIETWNPGAERLYGYSAQEMIGQSITRLLPDEDFAGVAHMRERLLAGEPVRDVETRERRKDGSLVDVSVSISPITDDQGRVVGMSSIVRDITARKAAEGELRRYGEHLEELALEDHLTGLGNHRQFHAALDRELERSRTQRDVFSVALFAVDGFGQLDQARRRREGDRMLCAVAAALRDASRCGDTAVRVGGGEFALVLPQTDEAGARRTAEQVRAALARSEPGLGLSCGIASWPAAGESKDLLLVRADLALHASKPSEGAANGPGRELAPEVTGQIERVLAVARRQLGMELTFLGEFREGSEVLRAVDGDSASFGLTAGTELALPQTYCQRMADGRIACAVPDAGAEPEVAELAVTREAGIGAYVGVPLVLPDGRLYGALCGVSHAPKELSARHVELMRFLAELVTELLAAQEREAQQRRDQLETSGIHALVAALEARDHYTGEHSRTVVALAGAVAQRLGLSQEQVLEVEQVAILHDVGKVGIPDQVLQKRDPLSDDEWELMRQHPVIGERIVAAIQGLGHLAPAIRAEHEHYDGTGYPDGLRREELPIASRITLACDAYHAMTSDRPYRAALSVAQARAELTDNAGTRFDPQVVEALLGALDEAPPAADRPPAPERPRRPIPPWAPTTEAGAGCALGQLRCACRTCGSHLTALVSQTSLSGNCATCGSHELDVVGR